MKNIIKRDTSTPNISNYKTVNGLIKELEKYGKEKGKIEKKYMEQLYGGKKRFYYIYNIFLKLRGKGNLLDVLENKYVGNLKAQQKVLIETGKIAIKKRDDLEDLRDSLKTAKEENWTIEQYMDYVMEKGDIPIYSETLNYLEKEIQFLPEEMKKEQEKDIYERLERNIEIGEKLMVVLGNCAGVLIEEFKKTAIDYYSFKQFSGPLKAINSTAEQLITAEKDTQTIREAMIENLKKSNEGIILAIQAMQQLKEFRLSSEETAKEVEKETSKLEQKLQELGVFDGKLLSKQE